MKQAAWFFQVGIQNPSVKKFRYEKKLYTFCSRTSEWDILIPFKSFQFLFLWATEVHVKQL